jgi:Tfp pilus assembly protein PilE
MDRLREILRRAARDESGVTLIELLVVMIVAIITSIALFTFQDLALRQTTKVFARADATQEARVAIEKMQNRLHSSCVADGATPIRAGSDQDTLIFWSKYSSAASVVPDQHVIELSNNQLVDTTYISTGGTVGDWDYGAPATNPAPQLLLDRVEAPNVSASAPNGVAFKYYAYGQALDGSNQPYKDAAGNPFYMLLDGTTGLPAGLKTSGGASVPAGTMPSNNPSPLAVPLTEATAATVAGVSIDLIVSPSGRLGQNSSQATKVSVSDSVVLRITPVPSDNNQGTPMPCQ